MSFGKNTDKKALTNDLVKNAVIMLTAHVISNTRSEKKLFNEESMNVIIYTLLGFVFYHVVFVNIVPPV